MTIFYLLLDIGNLEYAGWTISVDTDIEESRSWSQSLPFHCLLHWNSIVHSHEADQSIWSQDNFTPFKVKQNNMKNDRLYKRILKFLKQLVWHIQ